MHSPVSRLLELFQIPEFDIRIIEGFARGHFALSRGISGSFISRSYEFHRKSNPGEMGNVRR
jgi:hypothetical protein